MLSTVCRWIGDYGVNVGFQGGIHFFVHVFLGAIVEASVNTLWYKSVFADAVEHIAAFRARTETFGAVPAHIIYGADMVVAVHDIHLRQVELAFAHSQKLRLNKRYARKRPASA